MQESLRSALELTVLGMGMTFLSIGALTLGMYVMTAVFRGKDRAVVLESDQDQLAGDAVAAYREGGATDGVPVDDEARRRAAAAAVAVAMALAETQQDASAQPAWHSAVVAPELWNAFARSLHLSRRAQYDARRFRG